MENNDVGLSKIIRFFYLAIYRFRLESVENIIKSHFMTKLLLGPDMLGNNYADTIKRIIFKI